MDWFLCDNSLRHERVNYIRYRQFNMVKRAQLHKESHTLTRQRISWSGKHQNMPLETKFGIIFRIEVEKLLWSKTPWITLSNRHILIHITMMYKDDSSPNNDEGKTKAKKVVLFLKIGLVKTFLSSTRWHKSNVYENIYFLFQKNTHKQKKFC